MIEHSPDRAQDDNPQRVTPLRIVGESDRPADFRAARDMLIGSIHGWLQAQAILRDSGEALVPGITTSEQPLIVTSDFGPSGPVSRTQVMKQTEGVFLGGDGVTTPFVYQRVTISEQSGATEVVEVRGADPVNIVDGQVQVGDKRTGTAASLRVEEYSSGDDASQFSYDFSGSGEVLRGYLRDDGYNVVSDTRDVADMQLAQLAFAQITGSEGIQIPEGEA